MTRRDTHQKRHPLAVLIPATSEQRKSGKYDGGRTGVSIALNSPEARDYVNTFGAYLGYFERPMVEVGGKNLNGDKLISAARQVMGDEAWQRYIAVQQIRDAHERGDSYAMENAIGKMRGTTFAKAWKSTLGVRSFPIYEVPREFYRSMKRSQMVLWWTLDRLRFEPAVFCKDLTTAMWVRAAVRTLRSCPCCDTFFVPGRPDHEYCSDSCSERFRKRRQRAQLQ